MMITNATKNKAGGATNPNGPARREKGRSSPTTTIKIEVKINKTLDLLWTNGILPVRIT